MKDLSFFLLKNSIGAKMKKGIRNFCNGDGSTSTLNQNQTDDHGSGSAIITPSDMVTPPSFVASNTNSTAQTPPTTLEEMILRLELEEELARKSKLNEYYHSQIRPGRMSCVNNSDILRSARNALNQYPRFSLDGKDAMYRSSFRNDAEIMGARKSVCCDHGLRERYCKLEPRLGQSRLSLPSTFGGESVIWCKPGVVAKLMGLDSIPVPVSRSKGNRQKLGSLIKRQNLRRRTERHEMERKLAAMDMSSNYDHDFRKAKGSCSKPGDGGWPTRRFL
ncbi:hypothetical protein PTKIN_Ptkin04bG0036800 [Pterospermum kingtungense]